MHYFLKLFPQNKLQWSTRGTNRENVSGPSLTPPTQRLFLASVLTSFLLFTAVVQTKGSDKHHTSGRWWKFLPWLFLQGLTMRKFCLSYQQDMCGYVVWVALTCVMQAPSYYGKTQWQLALIHTWAHTHILPVCDIHFRGLTVCSI